MIQASFRNPLLKVWNLSLASHDKPLFEGLSFEIHVGQSLALIGPSGSGKSLTCLALTGCLPNNANVIKGEIRWNGVSIGETVQLGWNRIAGCAMVVQNSQNALNPSRRVGSLFTEKLRHLSKAKCRKCVSKLVNLVGLTSTHDLLTRFPGQLSGGQLQRLNIALALANNPQLLIIDEPVSSLDSLSQLRLLELLKSLQKDLGLALLIVTHNYDLILKRVDKVVAIVNGKGQMSNDNQTIRHLYSNSDSKVCRYFQTAADKLPEVCRAKAEQPIIQISNAIVDRKSAGWLWKRPGWQLEVSTLNIFRGEIVAIVGESGAGKTTLLKMLLGLLRISSGHYLLNGKPVSKWSRRTRAQVLQPVFQNSGNALNPVYTIRQILVNTAMSAPVAGVAPIIRVADVIEQVGLSTDLLSRFPSTLSGGQQQRVSIAKALLASPLALLLDEPFSALDPLTRAQVIDLLLNLWRCQALTLLIATHDLAFARNVAQRIIILDQGKVIESGETIVVFKDPKHKKTKALVDCANRLYEPLTIENCR